MGDHPPRPEKDASPNHEYYSVVGLVCILVAMCLPWRGLCRAQRAPLHISPLLFTIEAHALW